MKKRNDIILLFILACIGIILFFTRIGVESITSDLPENTGVGQMLTLEEAQLAAAEFAEQQFRITDADTVGYINSEEEASVYLQKHNLFKTYDDKLSKALPIDYYQVEVRDLDNGHVYVISLDSYSGKPFAWSPLDFSLDASNPAEAQTLSIQDQQTMVETTLTDLGYQLDAFQLINTPETLGDSFNYSLKSEQVGKLSIDLWVTVQGNQITALEPSYTIPVADLAWKTHHDDWSSDLGLAGWIIIMITGFIAMIAAIVIRKRVSFSRGIILTVSFFAIQVIMNIIMLPALYTEVVRSGVFGSEADSLNIVFIVIQLFMMFFVSVGIYFSLIAGDAMWRKEGWKSWLYFKDPEFEAHILPAMGRGYLLCAIILGVQSLIFMLSATQFDIFGTNKPSSSIYNITVPALFPLMAWAAAISEEAIFRLFGIIALKKLVRYTWISVLITSFLWALGHSGYLYPFYARLIEVTILGFLFAFIFLRYGFITVVFAHAIMDAFLMGVYTMGYGFSIGSAMDALLGISHIALPAVITFIIYGTYKLFKKMRKHPHPPEAIQ